MKGPKRNTDRINLVNTVLPPSPNQTSPTPHLCIPHGVHLYLLRLMDLNFSQIRFAHTHYSGWRRELRSLTMERKKEAASGRWNCQVVAIFISIFLCRRSGILCFECISKVVCGKPPQYTLEVMPTEDSRWRIILSGNLGEM